MRRLSGDARYLLVMITLFTIGTFFIVRHSTDNANEEWMPRRTTYSARPGGLKALYLTLREIGYDARQFRQPLTALPERGVLFIVAPDRTSPGADEWGALMNWVRAGNVALLASDARGMQLGLPLTVGGSQASAQFLPDEEKGEPAAIHPLTAGISDFRAKSAARMTNDEEWGPPDILMGQSIPRSKGVGKGKLPAFAPIQRSTEPTRAMTPLVKDRVPAGAKGAAPLAGVLVAGTTWGRGHIILVSSPGSLANDMIARGDNLLFVLNLMRWANPRRQLPVLFDEFHHGYGAQRGLMSLFGSALRLAGGQLGLASLGGLWLVSRRRSRPVPLPRAGQRARGEYLTSLSLFFKRARAHEVVRQAIGAEFIARTTQLLGLPMNASLDTVARAAHEQRGIPAERMIVALTACGPAAAYSLKSDADILGFARELYELRRQCSRM